MAARLTLAITMATAAIIMCFTTACPPGNLILGGGTINQNAQINSEQVTTFSNLTINPGASTFTQSARTASEYGAL
jgi:hypothetical protein